MSLYDFPKVGIVGSFVCILSLTVSCEKIETEFDCGEVSTQITALYEDVGSYSSSIFTLNNSTNFEEAAIAVYVEDFIISSETETNCFAFTALPQLIENIRITSSASITSGGTVFGPGQNVMNLFKLINQEQTYSIPDFIEAQNDDPIIYHMDGDNIILQLLNQPDEAINQSFEIELRFTDTKVLSIEIPSFEVSN